VADAKHIQKIHDSVAG